MATIDQPTSAPTPKVTAATLGAAVAAAIQAYVIARFPIFRDPVIWVPLAPLLAGSGALVAGYFRRMTDRWDEWSWWPLVGGLALIGVGLGFGIAAF